MATQTLLDLYLVDSTIINIPTNGLPQGIDRDLVKSYILDACGECVPRYQTVEKYKVMNDLFYKTHQKEFEHLLKVVNADYSPIENTDRYTSISDSTSEDESGTNQKTTSQTSSGERDDTSSITNSGTSGNTQTHTNGISDTVTESGTLSSTDTLAHDTTRSTVDSKTDTLTHDTDKTFTENKVDLLTHDTTRAVTESKTETPGAITDSTAEETVSADNVSTYSPDRKTLTHTAMSGTNTTAGTSSETLTGSDRTQSDTNSTESLTGTDETVSEGSATEKMTGTDTTTTSGTDSRTTTTAHTGQETVSDQGSTSSTGSTTSHSENSGSLSGTENGTDSREKTTTYEHTEHTHGNIGVTTNSQMLTGEVNDVIMSGIINIYKMISVMYDDYMMIGVY